MPTPLKTTDPKKLITDTIAAVTGARTFRQATRDISVDERQSLSRVIGQDVDEWRKEFGEQLRATGSKLLALLNEKADDIKPDALAYSIAVMADKAAALDGRSQLANASINVQINQYGAPSKSALLDQLEGVSRVVELAQEPFASNTTQIADVKTSDGETVS